MNNEKFMNEALKEAKKAYEKKEIPVGAVIVKDGKIIARGHNLKEVKNTALAHAETIAINKANRKLNNWRLTDCEMYVTLEPCLMCTGAILSSRISKLYIGTMDKNLGACKSIIDNKKYNLNNLQIETGILEGKCEYILKDFFKMLRK